MVSSGGFQWIARVFRVFKGVKGLIVGLAMFPL